MSAMDRFNELKKRRDILAALRWTCGVVPRVRLFDERCDDCCEYTVSDAEVKDISNGLGVTEHVGGTSITYAGSYVVGNALKTVTLRYLDNLISSAALDAEKEALEVLAVLKEARK